MKNCDILLKADCLVTQDDERRVISKGAVAVSGDSILAAGSLEDLAGYTAAREIDLGPAILMPGLVNAHTHLPMTLLRGIADDLPLMEWLTDHIFPLEAKFTPEILQIGTALACAEMIRSGTTALFDMYLNEPPVYRTVDQCGLRARVCESLFSFPSIGVPDPSKAMDVVREQAAELKDNPRVKFAVSPHSVYTTTPELLENCAALARELKLPISIHLAETATETEQCLAAHNCRPVELCRRTGILGPHTTAAHCVELLPEEIDLLAQTQTVIAHNPKSNMKLASGAAPLPALLAKGARLALGTDGASSNNALNMFSEMTFASLLQKVTRMDPVVMPAQTVLDMATRGGADALHWPGLGRIMPGSPADMIALSLSYPNLNPLHDPVSHIVYAASGHELAFSMVGGKILYTDGAFTSLDYPALLEEAARIGAWLREQKSAS
ncbi:amidohydrolase [Desulfovibrio sp. OttesenSCG-928-C14]|nr:amidohydrolase [Desulfovibrio sp. OttesenSCG-928-C14]